MAHPKGRGPPWTAPANAGFWDRDWNPTDVGLPCLLQGSLAQLSSAPPGPGVTHSQNISLNIPASLQVETAHLETRQQPSTILGSALGLGHWSWEVP